VKHLVYYDDTNGNIEDSTGIYIGQVGAGINIPNPVEGNKGTDIDSLIKLKASGFTADDLIKMGVKL
jgi:hypothetical protein